MTVADIYNFIDNFAPFSSAASWDNSGLLVGNMKDSVEKVVICLDVTQAVIDFAKAENAQLIISHHPVIFKPLKSLTFGNVAYSAARAGLSIICAHTNLDKAVGGVNDTLCELFAFFYEKLDSDVCDGFLNIVTLPEPMKCDDFVKLIKERLHTAVSFCDCGNEITKIGVCSGSGADFVFEAKKLNCDAFLTGEASYHEFLDAKAADISLFAAGHFETEIPVVSKLAEKLSNEFDTVRFIEAPPVSSVLVEK